MFTTHLITLFLQYIPESITLVFVALVLLRLKVKHTKIFGIGIIMGITTFVIRLLPVSFGFHTVLSLILLTAALSLICKTNGFKTFIAALKTYILLAVIEMVSINSFIYLTGYTIEDMGQNPIIRTLAVLPQIIILFTVGLLIKRFYDKRPLEGENWFTKK